MSKYNYAYSDYPFPDDTPDFPHHSVMSKYIHDYVKHNALDKNIRFNLEVVSVEKKGQNWLNIQELFGLFYLSRLYCLHAIGNMVDLNEIGP